MIYSKRRRVNLLAFDPPFLKTKSCSKCLLTGEHSVLYGSAAISVPLPLSFSSSLSFTRSEKPLIILDPESLCEAKKAEGLRGCEKILSIDFSKNMSIHKTLPSKYCHFHFSDLVQFYQNVATKKEHIERLGSNQSHFTLKRPIDLTLLTLGFLLEDLSDHIDSCTIVVQSDILPSRGMGSSAALILTFLKHFSTDIQTLVQRAQFLESFQHGISSGIDIRTIAYEKALIQQGDRQEFITLHKDFWTKFTLIDTGPSENSTGECVAFVRKILSCNTALCHRFFQVTQKFAERLQTPFSVQLSDLIEQNQSLLEQIQVVPQKVQQFLKEISSLGYAGKISGAGAISGTQCGLLLIEGVDSKIDHKALEYGYRTITLFKEQRTRP